MALSLALLAGCTAATEEPLEPEQEQTASEEPRAEEAGAPGQGRSSRERRCQGAYLVQDLYEHGRELWRSDGTEQGTRATLESLLSVDGKLLFRADDRIHGVEPWVSDGTERGTRMLRDIALGEESSFPTAFARAGSRVFFIANEGFTGMEPWAVPVSSLGGECRESTP